MGLIFLGVGTHLKYYIEEGGTFNDVTPVRVTTSLWRCHFFLQQMAQQLSL